MSSFVINSKEFLKSLQVAGKAVPNLITAPIFKCVLLEVNKNGSLIITGSDGNTVIRTQTEASEVELDSGDLVKIAAEYDLLYKTLSSISNAPVTITYIEGGEFNFRIELLFETDNYRIPCEDPTVFFRVPTVDDNSPIRIPGQLLQRGIDSVVECCADDQSRPALTGIYFVIEGDRIRYSAANGYVIGEYYGEYSGATADKSLVIPAKFMRMISEFIGDNKADVVFKVSDRHLMALMGDITAYTVLVDEIFPDYQASMPESFPIEAKVNAESFKTALKRGMLFADQKTPVTNLTFRGNNLFLNSVNPANNSQSDQDISIESDIEELEISFDMKRLTGLVRGVSGDFTLGMIGYNRAVVILPDVDEGESLKYVIMPVVPATKM